MPKLRVFDLSTEAGVKAWRAWRARCAYREAGHSNSWAEWRAYQAAAWQRSEQNRKICRSLLDKRVLRGTFLFDRHTFVPFWGDQYDMERRARVMKGEQ